MGLRSVAKYRCGAKGKLYPRALRRDIYALNDLDFFILLNERQLKLLLKPWVAHSNRGRPHMSLGPTMPALLHMAPPKSTISRSVPDGHTIRSTVI